MQDPASTPSDAPAGSPTPTPNGNPAAESAGAAPSQPVAGAATSQAAAGGAPTQAEGRATLAEGSTPAAGEGKPAENAWPAWMAPAALAGGLVLAAVGALLVDLPALALGVNVTSKHVPGGVTIADTAVQDAAFVGISVFFAQLGGRPVAASMFGLRATRLWRAVGLVTVTLVGFLLFSLIWTSLFHAGKEKILEQLGTNETTALLVLSAALTCVVAPIAEEFLFRGFIFTCLRNWAGTLPAAIMTGLVFGAVHAGSAPAVDLVPLAGLGFGLCLLYRATGSLYPCIAAHCVNNSLAFGDLEGWGWQILVLMAASLSVIALLALALKRAGVITSERPLARAS